MVHREEVSKSVHLMSVVLARPFSGKDHMRKPCTKKDAPAEQRGIWRNMFTSSRLWTELRFTLLLKPGQCWRPLQNYQRNENSSSIEENQCTCWAKKDLSSDELDTLRRSRNPTVVVTANGEAQTHDTKHTYSRLFVTVQLLEETLAFFSLGRFCEDHRYFYEWVCGQKPRVTKEEKTIVCKTDNIVLLVVPGNPPVLGAFRLQHRHRRICLRRVQPKSEVTDWPHESGAERPQKPKTKKRGTADEMRTTVCEIFLNGWRSSQIIWRTQNCLCPHTFLRNQIRNGLQKWYQNHGSTVFILTSQKTEIAKSVFEPKTAKQYLELTNFATW